MVSISRNFTSKIRFVIDEFIPPIIRDQKWFMYIAFKVLYGENAELFMNFKSNAFDLTETDFIRAYNKISLLDSRNTDLNTKCVDAILANIVGSTVLEVGCGKGYLASKMSEKYSVLATDISIDSKTRKNNPNVKFKNANVEKLPFKDCQFDTVVCTHTLEHVQQIFSAIDELRRVAKNRLIIVVPAQKPYRYTFDLHLHFFPYAFSLAAVMNDEKKRESSIKNLDGELFYVEERK